MKKLKVPKTKLNKALQWTGWKQPVNRYGLVAQVIFLGQLKRDYCKGQCHHCFQAVGWYENVVIHETIDQDSRLTKKRKDTYLQTARDNVIKAVTPMLEKGLWKESKEHNNEEYQFVDWRPLKSPDLKPLR